MTVAKKKTRTQHVIDKQNLDGSWRGVASLWGDTVTPELLAVVLAAFRESEPAAVFKLSLKVRTYTVETKPSPLLREDE
jgi:hypothetical protein